MITMFDHCRRKASLEAVIATESTIAHRAEQAAALREINARALPLKPLTPSIEAWMMHFEEIDDRYKVLILHGPSRTGKSRLARSLFGAARTLVVDVQHAAHPDLRSYRRGVHRAVLLDEMRSPEFVISNKKVLQAHIDGAILGQSATQLYTYEFFLWRTPVIITTNNWDCNQLSQVDQEWIKANTVEVLIDAPVWHMPKRAAETESTVAVALGKKRDAATLTPSASPEHKHVGACCSMCGQRLPPRVPDFPRA